MAESLGRTASSDGGRRCARSGLIGRSILPLNGIIGSSPEDFSPDRAQPTMPTTPIDRLTASLDFQATALSLHAERAKVLASNIANADTPNYQAKDFDFNQALALATARSQSGSQSASAPSRTHPGHLAGPAGTTPSPVLQYRQPLQAALDGNSVDLDTERAAFAENSVRYEATLRFLNSQIKTMLSAINGQ